MRKLILLCLLLSGCTSINVSLNSTAGDSNKPAIRTDADQSPATPINAAVPVSVGASPNSTGSVGK